MNHRDDNTLLRKNLEEVFNERDATRRSNAIKALYADRAVFYEGNEKFEGLAAITARFDEILTPTPPDFKFRVAKPAGRIDNLEQLTWQLGPTETQVVASGLDVALISGEKIEALYTFVDAAETTKG